MKEDLPAPHAPGKLAAEEAAKLDIWDDVRIPDRDRNGGIVIFPADWFADPYVGGKCPLPLASHLQWQRRYVGVNVTEAFKVDDEDGS